MKKIKMVAIFMVAVVALVSAAFVVAANEEYGDNPAYAGCCTQDYVQFERFTWEHPVHPCWPWTEFRTETRWVWDSAHGRYMPYHVTIRIDHPCPVCGAW